MEGIVERDNDSRDLTPSISTNNLRIQGIDTERNKQGSIPTSKINQSMIDKWEPRETVITSFSNDSSRVTQQVNYSTVSTEEEENTANIEISQNKADQMCTRAASLNIGKKPGR